jgi:hypothetical protein
MRRELLVAEAAEAGRYEWLSRRLHREPERSQLVGLGINIEGQRGGGHFAS